jgi:hypothetical protein
MQDQSENAEIRFLNALKRKTIERDKNIHEVNFSRAKFTPKTAINRESVNGYRGPW